MSKRGAWIPAVVAAAVLTAALACSPSQGRTATQPPVDQGNIGAEEGRITWNARSDRGVDVVFATPDLGPGRQRIAFVLSDQEGLVRLPFVQTEASFAETGEMIGSEAARFFEFPLGTRGIYIAYFDLPAPRAVRFVARVPRPDGSVAAPEILAEVSERPRSVAVGERPPSSRNKTAEDVQSIAELTTGSLRDPALYTLRFDKAFISGKPTVAVFASPAFCTNAICGPQVEVASKLAKEYAGRANFIHVDIYDNPDEIQGDLSVARLSPVVREWGLTSEEWTFVIDKGGLVHARFENFAPEEEVRQALDAALGG